MDDNNLNKKQKLEHELTDHDLEGVINNGIVISRNFEAVNDNIKQSNAFTVDVHNSGERKSYACTKNSSS